MFNGDSSLREFGGFRLDPRKRVLWYGDEPVNLPLKDIELLCVLTESAGQVITKDEIIEKVWADSFVEESNLTRHIYLLRKTLKEYGEPEDLIQTVPRRGYRFTGKVRSPAGGDLVVEKHTSTRTLIEISDNEAARGLPAAAKGRPVWLMIGSAAAVLLVSGVLLWNFGFFSRTAQAAEIRSIAVLPVRSFSEAADDEELRLRLTDALITRLGNMDRIAVRPTSAVLPFAASDEDSISIGKRLRVDAVIESRVQQEGDRLRVTMQMIRTADGAHLWSEQFDGNAGQILSLQDTIFAKVADSLADPGLKSGTAAKRLTENSDAYEAYLKGRFFWGKRDEASLRKAVDYFTQAATLDPQFAEAFAGLADTQHLLFNYNIDVRPELVAEAKENLRRALELKPDSHDALVTLGTIEMGYDWDWKKAGQTLRQAVAAAPNSPLAHMRHGALLVRIRQFDEAEAEFRRQIELDPLSIAGVTNLAMTLFCKKEYAAAEEEYNKVLELDDKSSAPHWLLSRNMWMQGRKEDSVARIVKALELDRNPGLSQKVAAAAQNGTADDAVKLLLHEWRMNPPGTNPHNLAYLSTYVNDTDKAVYWLKVSIDEHHPWTSWIAAAPEFEVLRGDQRYMEMLRSLQLP